MPSVTSKPPFDQFLAAAETAISTRPHVDPDMIREIFEETATMIDNSLALDDLDDHDTNAAIGLLCADLVTDDPGAAIRARSELVLTTPGGLHDPEAVSAALLVVTAVLRI